MARRYFIILLLIFAPAKTALAHPHAFVECVFFFVMDQNGLVGFKQRWTLDEMTTVSVLDVVDKDRNGLLSAKEKRAIKDLSVESLSAYNYFTTARINGKNFQVKKIADFSAELKNGKLIYEFLVPCRVKPVPGHLQEVKAAVYDDSFYTFVAYADEGVSRIDPTKDPLFTNKQAPARPEDFKRFSKAVGWDKFKGSAKIIGNAANFKMTSVIREEQDMAYFYDQIIPQAFVLSFEPK